MGSNSKRVNSQYFNFSRYQPHYNNFDIYNFRILASSQHQLSLKSSSSSLCPLNLSEIITAGARMDAAEPQLVLQTS